MFGIMYLMELRINPANLMALPLIFGIGVDHGIHIVLDYQRHRNWSQMLVTTGHAVVITSTTTIIGFGSLALANYRGLSSLGQMMIIGVFSCLFTSLVFLPCFWQCFIRTPRVSEKFQQ